MLVPSRDFVPSGVTPAKAVIQETINTEAVATATAFVPLWCDAATSLAATISPRIALYTTLKILFIVLSPSHIKTDFIAD